MLKFCDLRLNFKKCSSAHEFFNLDPLSLIYVLRHNFLGFFNFFILPRNSSFLTLKTKLDSKFMSSVALMGIGNLR